MRKLSGWQKFGLFAGVGCFSLIALMVIGVAVAMMWARSKVAEYGDPTPTRVERTIPLRDPAALGTAGAKAGLLELDLDLEEGNFTIRPDPAVDQVRVDGRYAENHFALTQTYTAASGDRPPRTVIRFRSKTPGWARFLAGMGQGAANRPQLTLLIPTSGELDLSLRVSMGESEIDLGGLALSDLDLELSMGNHQLDFATPLATPLRRVRLQTSMGNVSVEHLGNARAQSIDATGSMGNLTADLGGAWPKGDPAELSFTHSMGELTVRVPRDVRLETESTSSQPAPPPDPALEQKPGSPDAPVVRLRMTTSMGESRVRRY